MRTAYLIVAATAAALAQQGDPPAFSTTTRLVQVNIVATAKKGQPVADLKREDFTVLEKGKPQKIAFFAIQDAALLSVPSMKLPPNIFSNRFGDRTNVPQSVTVILLDSLNTPWSDQAYARNQVIRFLKQIQPHERVALYSMGRGLRILHDYTTDASSLIERLNRWTAQAEPDLAASAGPLDNPDRDNEILPKEVLEHEQRFADFIAGTRVVNTLRVLESVAEHLAAVPGRKSLIWVSGGFPLTIGFNSMDDIESGSPRGNGIRDQRTFFDEVERTVRAFNHANVAIYPVDARGLMVDPIFSASRSGMPKANAKMWSPPNLDTMEVLAGRTGGKAYYNRNDIDGAVREVFEDSRITYTLAYYPTEPDPKGNFRELKIKVNRPGVSLRYRKGYFGLTEVDSTDTRTIEAELRNALWSPLDATAVGLNARVDRHDDQQLYVIVCQVDPSTISLKHTGDRWTGRLDFAFVQKDETGKNIKGFSDTLQLNLTKQTYLKMLKEGLLFQRLMPMIAGGRELRVVVRDAPFGLAGSVTVPLNKLVASTQPAEGK